MQENLLNTIVIQLFKEVYSRQAKIENIMNTYDVFQDILASFYILGYVDMEKLNALSKVNIQLRNSYIERLNKNEIEGR